MNISPLIDSGTTIGVAPPSLDLARAHRILDAQVDTIASIGARLAVLAEGIHWHSPAATAFRASAAGLVDEVGRVRAVAETAARGAHYAATVGARS